jgi:hypothetical protein
MLTMSKQPSSPAATRPTIAGFLPWFFTKQTTINQRGLRMPMTRCHDDETLLLWPPLTTRIGKRKDKQGNKRKRQSTGEKRKNHAASKTN